MATVTVTSNVRAVKKGLTKIQRRELPKAIRNALNDTAFDVRRFVVNTLYPRSFRQARNKRFPGVAFRVQKATVRNLVSAVFDRLDRYFLPLHIEGGVKKARGNSMAIPINVNRLASGKISKARQPLNIPRSFKADLKGRGEGIWQRSSNGRNIKLMHSLKDRVPIDKRFPFFRLGAAKARQVFSNHIRREAKFAIKRAERKINQAKVTR